ncbi:MAG TPA: PIF1 family DEAD/DEAH box helicase [Candidatus Paceibacterota bacterium]|jgi:ATP-dependent exoDNAse (exonuclease V) alpha subunit|nr:PIF1 family DEAD/DEAH box helicase [Candidatus Paceibacterota bacterium]
MTQSEALNILKTGANIFLTGEPGSGKTYTINTYVSYLRTYGVEPAITASTGIAATHIGGMTIHSWSGIGIKNRLDKYDLDKIASSEYISKRVRRTKVLIIDEVSMLSAGTLDMVDMVCREIKQSDEAFGGIQIVLVGDFFQLPPIIKKDFKENTAKRQNSLLDDENVSTDSGTFAYEGSAWQRAHLVVCYLGEQHRQDDKEFLSVLSAIRANNVTDEHLNYINKRQMDYDDMSEEEMNTITKLFSHNLDVDRVNYGELSKIEEEAKIFEMMTSGNDRIVETLKKGCLSPESLELKIGAVVMCTKNNQKERFANGTLGTVTGFEEFSGTPIIKTRSGRSITIHPMDWVVEENGKIRAQITQVPLRLAWAITVHKSQGMSMDAAVMDLSQVFEFGQGYVALSRVRRLSGLYLLGINEHAFKVSPQVLEQDIMFKKTSAEAEKVFGKLAGPKIRKMHKDFIVVSGGKLKKD